jgi:hypothetical protein
MDRHRRWIPPVLIALLGVALALVFFFVVHAFVVGWARYSVPVVPAAIVLAFGIFPFRIHAVSNA